MKLVLITQDSPFYLAECFDYLLENLPEHSRVAACVMAGVSPFGKPAPIHRQALDTIRTFGFRFFCRYSLAYLTGKLWPSYSLRGVLEKHRIPIIDLKQSINDTESLDAIKLYEPDLLISIAGNQIFKKPVIKLAPRGCLNLHTALLPKYRGLMPTFWVMLNGEDETGVSVFFVDEGIDSGPIVVQKRVKIGDDSQRQLIEKTKRLGMDAIIESIEKIQNDDVQLMPNPDDEMSYFSKPTRADVRKFLAAGKRFF